MNTYEIECPICDIKTTVEVHYEEDIPQHCPMCGEDIEPVSEEEM
jgi:transcription initiation factor IIE alpha subunit